jgi:hypothetical protein
MANIGPSQPSALQVVEMYGATCIFEWDNYQRHLKEHPELGEPWFWPNRVTSTLKKPHLIIEDAQHATRIIYYRKEAEYSVGSRLFSTYTKVIVEMVDRKQKNNSCIIISAWNISKIKELNYTHCRVVYSDGTICNKFPNRKST